MIRVVDLFSGAGGLTLGFKKKILNNSFVDNNIFDILFANELNENAAKAFKLNFPTIPLFNCSITEITESYLSDNEIDYQDVDIVIGGPPCQSFSTVGKRQYDERALMYREYKRLLSFIQPKVFLFENVTGLLTMKNNEGGPVLDDIRQEFADFTDFESGMSYRIEETVLNAKHFGVPQNRERVFLVGIRSDLKIEQDWEFPERIYLNDDEFLTLEEAIGDLPNLTNGESKELYELDPYTDYQRMMRGNSNELNNHANALNGEKMLQIMQAVIPGEGRYYINELVESGVLDRKYYLTSGYKNTYGKLWWDRPCSTITNSLSTPSSLRCIHPIDSRPLTSREGARIQSFPDSFKFVGTKDSINSQIGNAVPPLLGVAIADKLELFFNENFNNKR